MKRSLLAMLCLIAASSLNAATTTATLPEFSGALSNGGFPLPAVTVGTLTFSFADPSQILSATFSSTFGNQAFPNSAGADVYVGGVLVGTCVELDICDVGDTVTPFTYTFHSSDFVMFASGSLPVTVIQTGGNIVRLGVETLTITIADTPEPASAALLGIGLAAAALLRRRREARD